MESYTFEPSDGGQQTGEPGAGSRGHQVNADPSLLHTPGPTVAILDRYTTAACRSC